MRAVEEPMPVVLLERERSQAPLDWSHKVGRAAENMRSGRATPQPLLERKEDY